MGNLTTESKTLVAAYLNDDTPATLPTLPYKVHLMTANGSETTPGTKATGSAYVPQTLTFVGTAELSNDTTLAWSSIDASASRTIVGVEVWDSAGSPVRWMWGPLASPRTVAAGEPCEFAIGDLVFTP